MWLKSIFISVYVVISVALLGLTAYLATGVALYITVFALVAVLPFLLFLAKIYLVDTPRTQRFLPLLIILPTLSLLVSTVCFSMGDTCWRHVFISLTALLGNSIYLLWYSKFSSRESQVLKTGKRLPDFELRTIFDEPFPSSHMRKQPSLILFYRGNWCAICTAQVKEIAAKYRELEKRGINVYMVSPQPSMRSAKLAQQFNAPMLFLADPDNIAAEQLNIDVKGGLPLGLQALGYQSDSVMPTVIMTNAKGIVFFADITDNYRVRPLPKDFIKEFDIHAKISSLA